MGPKDVNRQRALPAVLIVDDEHSTTLVLERLLQGAGFSTLCAHDLASAKALAASQPVALILLDVNLPDGNGLDWCEQFAAGSRTPVLFISASDDLATKVRGFAAGGVDYITKPLAGAEVLARVRTHLRLRAAYDALADLQAERIGRLADSQQSLMPLPESLPEAIFQVCLRQVLHAGGDFYDVFPAGNRVVDYVVADASGHDLGTSLWTAAFKALLLEYASVLHSPLDICRTINGSLRRLLPEGAYFTAIYARLNRAANKLVLVNAGHPAAILYSSKTRVAKVLLQQGDLIGIFPEVVFGLLEVSVQPGDRLFLYTDGLIEMDSDRDAGTARLTTACQATAELPLAAAVAAIVDTLCAGAVPADDIVLMGIGV